MAKLYFYYGTVKSGKTMSLIQTAKTYENQNLQVIILKPVLDNTETKTLTANIGFQKDANFIIQKEDNILTLLEPLLNNTSCILVDNAHLLSSLQVDVLFNITKTYNIPVITYGLRTDAKTGSFIGSKRLLEIADTIKEIKSICHCGKKAIFNAKKINNSFISDNESVIQENIEYVPLCGDCYVTDVLKMPKKY